MITGATLVKWAGQWPHFNTHASPRPKPGGDARVAERCFKRFPRNMSGPGADVEEHAWRALESSNQRRDAFHSLAGREGTASGR